MDLAFMRYVEILERLIALRKKLGISQEKLAQRCGVSRETIRNLEQLQSIPNAKLFLDIMYQLDQWGGSPYGSSTDAASLEK